MPMPERPFNIRLSALSSRLLVLAFAAIVTFGAYNLWHKQLSALETNLGNRGWTLNNNSTPENRFTVIAIDEKSIAEIGPWPWPRDVLASLSTRLKEAGVSLQLYDIVFPEAKVGDTDLITALSRTPSIIGQVPDLMGNQPLNSGVMLSGLKGMRCQPPLPQTANYLANHKTFSQVSAGHITPIVNANGSIYQAPPLICVDGQVYPSLSLSGILKGLQVESSNLSLTSGAGWLEPHWQLVVEDYPELKIPLNAQGNMRISYERAPISYQVIPVIDVLNGQFDPEQIRNTWVLIGATAFGLGDIVPTPYSGATPGVEIQARMISSLLDNNIPYTPRLATFYLIAISIIMAAALLLLASQNNRFCIVARSAAVIVLPVSALLFHWQLMQFNIWLGWTAPALFALLASGLLALLEHSRIRIERSRIYTNLNSYLPANVIEDIAFNLPSGTVEASRKNLVIFSADLRNFSALQEAIPAEQAATLLHCFFVQACQIIEQNSGSVHEFKGDSVLATWPAGKAKSALEAAKQLQQQSDHFLPTQMPDDLSPLALGIGIEQGSTLVGSIGPEQRRTHTLLGETVTLALRIQEMTEDLAQPILLGSTAAKLLPDEGLEAQGDFLLDGLRIPHTLYAPFDESALDDLYNKPKLAVLQGGAGR